ncbi:MAG: DUF4956 domain-containing protein [Sphingobacteriales bacterium JAD_PAG50586_3]|nr:MAG: DUF4956 domain-containing protein [Sphingobacteriales bacterium JAD_PAG50586_3]
MDIQEFYLSKLNGLFFLRLLIDIVFVAILIRFVYYKNYRKGDTVFTFFLFNVVIFIITYLLNIVDISLGAAFGLFAVFSMIRYRTEDISAKDMTYLFIVIAIGMITAIAKESMLELCLLNGFIVGLTFALDRNFFFLNEQEKVIESVDLELIKPENRLLLLSTLKEKTGYDVHRITVSKIDLTKNKAIIRAYYYNGKDQ